MEQDRRTFIKNLSILAALGAAGPFINLPAFANSSYNAVGLSDLSTRNGIEFGSCVSGKLLQENAKYREILKKECSMLVAENVMKWKYINPEPDSYNFRQADMIVDFAAQNNQLMRFHTLVWGQSYPDWLNDAISDKSSAEAVLRTYADKVLTRYRGKMRSWDIVNEPLRIEDNNSGGYQDNIWYEFLGPDYIAESFKIAEEYDLGGKMVLNENGIKNADRISGQKRQALLNIVKNLRDRDIRIDAVGIQSHLWAHKELADKDEYQQWLQNLIDEGVEIYITELDVGDNFLSGTPEERAIAGANYVEQYLKTTFEVTVPEEITMWGVWDGNSYVNARQKPWVKHGRPLIYTEDWDKNPLWYTMAELLENSQKN